MNMTGNFQPHWMCLLGQPLLIGLHVAADLAIFIAYSFISALLFQAKHNSTLFALLKELVQKGTPDLTISKVAGEWVFISFATFIGFCGLTHLMDIVVLWVPIYWVQAFIKIVTAFSSVSTAFILGSVVTAYLSAVRTHRLKVEIE